MALELSGRLGSREAGGQLVGRPSRGLSTAGLHSPTCSPNPFGVCPIDLLGADLLPDRWAANPNLNWRKRGFIRHV